MGQLSDRIEVKNVSIEFPGVKALKEVNCEFNCGEVKALIGANGAGKSTLMKVLAGANPTYTGQVLYNGTPVEIRNPTDARNLGISIVYQEVDSILIPNLSVAENVMIDYLIYDLKGVGVIDWSTMRERAAQVMKDLGIDIDVTALVSSLTLAQKQMVVIGRSIVQNCKFLILDEPTAPLSTKETEVLFELVRTLKARGCGVIFISHRLNELFEICEKIIVMKDGEIVGEREVDGTLTINDIVTMMLGRETGEKLDKSGRETGDTVLELKQFGDAQGRVHDINLHVKRGEIIGISGLVGAGKTELCKALFGAYGHTKGEYILDGKPVNPATTGQAVKAGLALIPEERRKEGIFLEESVSRNLSVVTLDKYSRLLGFVNRGRELETAKTKISQLLIKTPTPAQKVGLLSGGNQQKVTIGKWLDSEADLYIFDEPTKGIDVGAKMEIYKLIVTLARSGKAVIYTSSEQSEILTLSDRIYVMYDGTIQKELDPAATNDQEILFYCTGGK
ncbi:MAG: sugar ABC transporter ATP-binding protein [Solobacterium sp.]|nr:sugar ABC transporter ATP-binding protein [Solobacterium sp.]